MRTIAKKRTTLAMAGFTTSAALLGALVMSGGCGTKIAETSNAMTSDYHRLTSAGTSPTDGVYLTVQVLSTNLMFSSYQGCVQKGDKSPDACGAETLGFAHGAVNPQLRGNALALWKGTFKVGLHYPNIESGFAKEQGPSLGDAMEIIENETKDQLCLRFHWKPAGSKSEWKAVKFDNDVCNWGKEPK